MPKLRVVVTLWMDAGPSLPWATRVRRLEVTDTQAGRIMRAERAAKACSGGDGEKADSSLGRVLEVVLEEAAREIEGRARG